MPTALSDAYATAAQYRTIVASTDSGDDTQILEDLTVVSRYIDAKLGRENTGFSKDPNDATRIFVAEAKSAILYIDPLSAAPTSITVDLNGDGTFASAEALVATDYELRPLNAVLRPEPWPYESIWLTPWGTLGRFGDGDRVQVIGKFGWPSIPARIKQATIRLTAVLRLESPMATERIPEALEASFQASPLARSILHGLMDQYRAARFFA